MDVSGNSVPADSHPSFTISAPLVSEEEDDDDGILDQAPPTSGAVLPLPPVLPDARANDVHSGSSGDVVDSYCDCKQTEQPPVWKEFPENAVDSKTPSEEISCGHSTFRRTLEPKTTLLSQDDQGLTPDVAKGQELERVSPNFQGRSTKSKDEEFLKCLEFCGSASSDLAAKNHCPLMRNNVMDDPGQIEDGPIVAEDPPCEVHPLKCSHERGATLESEQDAGPRIQAASSLAKCLFPVEDCEDIQVINLDTSTESRCLSEKRRNSSAFESLSKPESPTKHESPTKQESLPKHESLSKQESATKHESIMTHDTCTKHVVAAAPQLGSENESETNEPLLNVISVSHEPPPAGGRGQGSETSTDSEEEDHEDDLQTAFHLFLPKRRKSTRISRARLVAFFLKYILFLLSFCFWIASVGAMTLGAWVLSERGQLVRDSASFFLDPSGMLCLLGAIVFLVAFCGCLGALRENIVLLKLVLEIMLEWSNSSQNGTWKNTDFLPPQPFQFSMVAVLAVESLIALFVFAFYQMPEFRKQLKGGPEEVLSVAIRRYHDDDELRRWIDWIQREFQCCGARHSKTGYRDWQQNPYFNCSPHNPSVQRCGVPRSCCIIERGEYINDMCGFDTTYKEKADLFGRIYTQGCMRGLGLWLSQHDVAIGAVSLAIIVPQIICVVLAHNLVQRIQQQRVKWTSFKATRMRSRPTTRT